MFKCKICKEQYKSIEGLYEHIEEEHEEMIPKDMSVQQYYYFMKTGKTHGNCVICKGATSWNPATNKYNRICKNPKCKEKYVEIFRERMIGKYGKVHLLNDPEQQKKMLANRSISGEYLWSDDKHKIPYTGSYELDFLKTLDLFFNWDPSDIMMPSPHVYYYEYEGEKKFYIPDVFIPSLSLEIEIKDGGDNPNKHHKIQAVDKVKEKKKDEVLKSQKTFHYMKLVNKNYANLFIFLNRMKIEFEKYGNMDKIPRMFLLEQGPTKFEGKELLTENTNVVAESTFVDFPIVEESTISFSFINSIIRKNSAMYSGGYITDVNKFKTSYINLINNASSTKEIDVIRKDVNNLLKLLKDNLSMDTPNIDVSVAKDLVFWATHDVKYQIDDRVRKIDKIKYNFIGDPKKPNKPVELIGKNGVEIIVLFDRSKCRTGKAFGIFDKNTSIVINRRHVMDRAHGVHVFIPDKNIDKTECMVYTIDGKSISGDIMEAIGNKIKPITHMFDTNKCDNSLFIANVYFALTGNIIKPEEVRFKYSGTYKNYEKGSDKK